MKEVKPYKLKTKNKIFEMPDIEHILFRDLLQIIFVY